MACSLSGKIMLKSTTTKIVIYYYKSVFFSARHFWMAAMDNNTRERNQIYSMTETMNIN